MNGRSDTLSSRRDMILAPSILSADFAALGAEIRAIDAAGADFIHIDVMDGHFVPNLTIGPNIVAALRPHSAKPFDVHLMIAPVDPYLKAFADAGADIITIHPEAGPHIHRSLTTIKALGKKAGLALNPGTPVEWAFPVLDLVDLVLVMTVNPGFGGQSFLRSPLAKLEALRERCGAGGRDVILEIDGGVTPETIGPAYQAGARAFVAGAAAFKGGPAAYAGNLRRLREAV